MYLTGSYISLQCYIMYTHNIFATFNNEDFSSFIVAIFEKSWFSKELSIQEIVFSVTDSMHKANTSYDLLSHINDT